MLGAGGMSAANPWQQQTMTELSLVKRGEKRRVRLALKNGMPLADLLEDPPACMAGTPLFQLAMWRRGWGPNRLREIGLAAVRDGINLFVPVEMASQRTLRWVASWDLSTARHLGESKAAA